MAKVEIHNNVKWLYLYRKFRINNKKKKETRKKLKDPVKQHKKIS